MMLVILAYDHINLPSHAEPKKVVPSAILFSGLSILPDCMCCRQYDSFPILASSSIFMCLLHLTHKHVFYTSSS
uniref:Uncharacterized protein n=1 Tax=Arundo donax TaxID=35708 RepID=A0A0A8YHR2_ARUDO